MAIGPPRFETATSPPTSARSMRTTDVASVHVSSAATPNARPTGSRSRSSEARASTPMRPTVRGAPVIGSGARTATGATVRSRGAPPRRRTA